MTEFNQHELKILQKLCKIKCSSHEEEILIKNLKRIIGFIDQINEVNIDNIESFSHIFSNGHSSLRDDIVENNVDHDEFISNSPEHVAGMVKVPVIIDKEG